MDGFMQAAWISAAAATLVFIGRARPSGARWILVALLTLLVALDKVLDLQTAVYTRAHDWVQLALDTLGLSDARLMLKGVLLAAATVLGLGGLFGLHRALGNANAGERLALAGFGLITILVGARMIPGLGWLSDQAVGWAMELVALTLILSGLLHAHRRSEQQRAKDVSKS